MTKTKITESLIRSSVASLSRPGTEAEVEMLVKRLAGHNFLGPRHAAVSAIVDALNQKRGEEHGAEHVKFSRFDDDGQRRQDTLRDVQEAAEAVRSDRSNEIRLTLAVKKAVAAGATPSDVERARKEF
jgi:hypothetical protein